MGPGVAAEAADVLAEKLWMVLPHLDERQRRLVLGAEAIAAGPGGVAMVARAAGVSWDTVAAGAAEQGAGAVVLGRVRRAGAGRRRAEELDPGLVPALEELVMADARGDPESVLLWTTRSLRNLARALTAAGHRCGPDTVARLLRARGFTLQGNAKVLEGREQHPDRDAQFLYISGQAAEHLAAGEPVISVDTKKKELIGDFARPGREWRPKGDPVRVRDHDFRDKDTTAVIPYGVYDMTADAGFVNVGTDHDTAAFAVESIRRWLAGPGAEAYPAARRLLITADAGGANAYRTRAWAAGLDDLAEESGLQITCCHFPPGTSKWNKIEHMLFSRITMNWRARPLTSHEVVLKSIAATRTRAGTRVVVRLDTGRYPTGLATTPAQLDELAARGGLTRHQFHGEWNFTVRPAPPLPPGPPPAPPPATAREQALDTLAVPALTGMTRARFDDLITRIGIPARAAREQRLYLHRGHPREKNSGMPPHLTPHAAVLAVILRQRHGMPCDLIGALFSTSGSTISLATGRTAPLLRAAGHHITPAAPIRTLDDLATALSSDQLPQNQPQHTATRTK
jgi:Rhodopirellula transposase DDE domain